LGLGFLVDDIMIWVGFAVLLMSLVNPISKFHGSKFYTKPGNNKSVQSPWLTSSISGSKFRPKKSKYIRKSSGIRRNFPN